MSYTIDVFRGRLRPTRDPLLFFAYLSLFPQLVAGPIVRAADLLPQLQTVPRTTPAMQWSGLRLIVHGYFKKVVIADNLAPVVNEAFALRSHEASGLYWWLIVTMFAYQIYCDFSGYSDIARGLARWMGYSFQVNFAHPYTSSSLREFWARWHISLSSWFRDYVYIPLGGSRQGPWRAYGSIFFVFMVSGLWHGAHWRFVIWGAAHGLFLIAERVTNWPKHLARVAGGRFVARGLVVLQVWIAWVFFRAESFGQAKHIIRSMFTSWSWSGQVAVGACAVLAVAVARDLFFLFGGRENRLLNSTRVQDLVGPVALAGLIAACVFLRGDGNEFIYFRF